MISKYFTEEELRHELKAHLLKEANKLNVVSKKKGIVYIENIEIRT